MASKLISPVIYPLDRDINKTWFVKYPSPKGGAPLKKYGKLASCKTLDEKIKEAERIIHEELHQAVVEYKATYTDQLIQDIAIFFGYKFIGLRPKSIVTYQSIQTEFISWYRLHWRQQDISLMGFEFQKYLQGKNLSNTTINNYRETLNGVFKKLVKAGKYPLNPFEITRKLDERRQTKDWFRTEDIGLLKEKIESTDKQLWLAINLQFYCFIRPNSEMTALLVSDIELSDRRIRIRAAIGKSGRHDEYVEIPELLMQDLADIAKYPKHYYIFSWNGKPGMRKLSKATMYRRHKKIIDALNYPKGYTYYSWKNTGAVHMLKAGFSILTISEKMRHKSLDHTRAYFKSLGFSDMREDLNKKYPVL